MSSFDKFLRFAIVAFVLLVIANGLPNHSGEYLEEQFINYDRPVSHHSTPGNAEKVLAMTPEEVATLWQLEVVILTPEQVAAEKAAAAKKVADKWQLEITP